MPRIIKDWQHEIDWRNHDGVNLSMINDFMRNQFYDGIMQDRVQGRPVVDIGFGTGLLSMIALKHGASNVMAFERDYTRYLLGCEIIERLNLTDRIELMHASYDRDTEVPYRDAVFVTETVNGNLWQEGLYRSLPSWPGVEWLPGRYRVEFYAVPVPDSFADGLSREQIDEDMFHPGIDLDSDYINCINDLIGESLGKEIPRMDLDLSAGGIVNFPEELNTPWQWIPYMRVVRDSGLRPIAYYELDVSTASLAIVEDGRPVSLREMNYDWCDITLSLELLETQHTTMLVVPRACMLDRQRKLYLDTAHWGPMRSAVLVTNTTRPVLVMHDFLTGDLRYELGD